MDWAVGRWTRTVMAAGLSPTEQAVAHALGMYADRRGGNVRPGVARLAKDVGVSERTVSRALVAIRKAGLAIIASRSHRFRGLADVYRLLAAPAVVKPPRSTDTTVSPTTDGTTGGSPAPDPISTAVGQVAGMGRREAGRLLSRARRVVRAGTPERAVLEALRAALPDDVASPASVLHSRLLNIEGMPEQTALAWLRGRVRRWTPTAHRTSTAPRTVEAFGATSLTLAGW